MNGAQSRKRRSRGLAVRLAAGGLAIGALLVGALPANAAGTPDPGGPNSAATAAATPAPVTTASTCTYTVVRNGAPAYATAGTSTTVVATYSAGNTVTSPQPCTARTLTAGVNYVQVNLVLGGVGWMSAVDLTGGH